MRSLSRESEASLEEAPDAGGPPKDVERVRGMACRVAVADEEGDVRGQPLRAQGGGGERRRHREEDHRAELGGGEHGAVLTTGNVDADDGHVGGTARGGDG